MTKMTEHPFTTWMRSTLDQAAVDALKGWMPEMVLALVESDREMLNLHQCHVWGQTCVTCDPEGHTGLVLHPCPTLRVRGEFWSRLYPDSYNEAWRPE